MDFYYHLCLFIFISSTAHSVIEATLSKDWLIEFHQPVEPQAAKRIAKRYAMVSRGPVRRPMRRQTLYSRSYVQVLKDQHLYHFIDLKPTHPQTRKKRDTVQEEFIQRHELVRFFSRNSIVRISRLFRSNEPFTKSRTVASNVAISQRAHRNTHHPPIPTFNISGIW